MPDPVLEQKSGRPRSNATKTPPQISTTIKSGGRPRSNATKTLPDLSLTPVTSGRQRSNATKTLPDLSPAPVTGGRQRSNATKTLPEIPPTFGLGGPMFKLQMEPVLPPAPLLGVPMQPASEQDTSEPEKISMTEYIGLCNDLKNDAILRIKNPVQGLLLKDKREQKRNGPVLLEEVAEIRQDLRTRMSELQDMDVKGDVTAKNMLFKGVVAVMIQADLQIDALKKSSGEAQVDANHYLALLKGKYPISHPLHTLTVAFSSMPQTVPQQENDNGITATDVLDKIQEVGDPALDLMGGSKDVAEAHATFHKMEKLKGGIEKAGWLDGVASVLGMLSKGYSLIKAFASDKEMSDEESAEFLDNLLGFASDLVDLFDTCGLIKYEKFVPIVGVIVTAISAVVNGVNTIRNLATALGARSSMKGAKRGLEERLVRNRDKEQKLGHAQPELQTMNKREGAFFRKKYEGISASTVAQQRSAFRQGFENENIYKKKVELKQQRAALLNTRQRTDAQNLQLEQLDQQIGQLRMAQDIQRLGVTDEAKSKQSKKAISASVDLAKIAIDLASAIAGLFPGIGDLVSAGLSLGKGLAEASSSAVKWIYHQTERYKRHQQRKQERRSMLADTVMERLEMLSSPEYRLGNLYTPNVQPNPYLVKAAYKEYDALALDLQRGMGAAPEVLATAESKELLKNRLIIAFSQEG